MVPYNTSIYSESEPAVWMNGSQNGEQLASTVAALSSAEAWGWAFLFVTIINLSSIMGIIFFPLMKKSFYTVVMRTMIGLAIGSLSGSALFHLIPAAFQLTEKSEGKHDYINIASFIWLSAWIVMILECTIKIVVKTKTAVKDKMEINGTKSLRVHNNNPSQNSHKNRDNLEVPNGDAHVESANNSGSEDEDDDNPRLQMSQEDLPIHHSTFSLNKRAVEMMRQEDNDLKQPKQIKTVAWIIIIGDSLHNFIDGISIGAGFVKSFSTGAVLSLAVMCEEFPHELGDFAILINSGLSVKKALLFNFMSALTCYLGMGLGILLGEIEWEHYIFAFAAGIFLYVALADMVPEVTTLIDEVSDIAPHEAWKVLVNHNAGIFVGITILYLLAKYQP